MNNKTLLFFTNAYPYGLGEQWKTNELKALVKVFDKIGIIPFEYAGNHKPLQVHPDITVDQPLFEHGSNKLDMRKRLSILNGPVLYFLSEFFRKKAFVSKDRFNNWNSSCYFITAMLGSPVVRRIMKEDHHRSVFYFYWGVGSCDLVPFFRKKFPEAKFFVRFHGYDLYEERNKNYIPFRLKVLEKLTAAIAISSYGEKYLKERYGEKADFRVVVNRLGTRYAGVSQPGNDNVLRVVSCALIIPLKRVHLIYRELLQLDFPVQWTHIGDGPEMEKLKKFIAENPGPHIEVIFKGRLTPDEVVRSYAGSMFDLFLHTSETEGVPVSIMEALSASIPVIATDAGGTKELVDESCGSIIPVDFTPGTLAEKITGFWRKNIAERNKLRESALAKYHQLCDAEINSKTLAEVLSK